MRNVIRGCHTIVLSDGVCTCVDSELQKWNVELKHHETLIQLKQETFMRTATDYLCNYGCVGLTMVHVLHAWSWFRLPKSPPKNHPNTLQTTKNHLNSPSVAPVQAPAQAPGNSPRPRPQLAQKNHACKTESAPCPQPQAHKDPP